MKNMLRKLLGCLIVVSVITISFITPSITSSASANTTLYNSEITNTKPIASKYIRIAWTPDMPIRYLYDDGMYRGYLNLTGVWGHPGGPALGGWLEGTVNCYKNCAIPASIEDETK